MSVPFAQFALHVDLQRAVAELGYEESTPVQELAIPLMLAGRDIVAQAQTGTGKTAAFALPILERLDTSKHYPQALIVVPTRELAIQVAEAMHRMGRYRAVSSLAIYGGQPIERQLRALRSGVQIVIGTPGRIMDHLRRGSLDLGRVTTVVLDEADEMLNMGFADDVEWILEHAPATRQTGLFSATMPPRIAALARRYLHEPERVAIETERATVPRVRQVYYDISRRDKVDALARLLDYEEPASTIVFCARKVDADTLGESLQGRGYAAEALHGDLNQGQRDRVMNRFRAGQVEILVATDVAARGLDIPDVSHVINFDIPWDPESYVHRIGRTGRAGREGDAITLVTPREQRQLRTIERAIGKKLQRLSLPSSADIAARRRDAMMDQIRATITEGNLDPYLSIVEELGDDYSATDIAAAAFKLLGSTLTPTDATSKDEQSAVLSDEPGMTRLFVRAGKHAGIRPSDIVGAIANEAKVSGRRVGAIAIYDNFTFVDISNDDVDRVVTALSGATLRGKPVSVDVARPQG